MKKSVLILLTSLLILSCAEEDFTLKERTGSTPYITFTTNVTEMEDMDVTRGGGHHNAAHHHDMTGARTPMFAKFTQTNNIDKYLKSKEYGAEVTRGRRIDTSADFYDSFGLISFMYPPSQTWSSIGSTKTPYVYNEKIRKADSWRSAEYWPGSGKKLTFFAYAPYNADGLTLSPSSQTGTPWLHYEVPLDAKAESDLLISANEHEVGNYNAIRYIDFKHICAGVRFGIGEKMAAGTIKKIQIADVYGEGWYRFGEAQWDSVKTEQTFTLDQTFVIAKGEQNKLLTTGDNVFMMVPQEVPEEGRIIVTIDDGEEHELVAYIAEDQWDIGTTTTYWLSTLVTDGDTVLSVSVENAPIAATGGTAQYEVGSYYTTAYGTRSPIPWTAYYTLDDDTTKYTTLDPEALTAFTFSGGSSPTQLCDITANSGIPRSVTLNTRILKNRPIKNEDLAIGTDKKGSANCYVVTNPGTYTFPCVYGNGIDKNGNAVPTAYSSNNFVNHAGTIINTIGPKIPEGDIDNVCIVWQDAAHLITPKSLKIVDRTFGSNTYKCIQFTIDTLNICQGNAVIAVRNASYQIMWSWHIWVTNRDIDHTIRLNNMNNGGYGTGAVISDIVHVPIGYCDNDTVKYTARKIHLTVIQPTSQDTARVVIDQPSGDAYTYGRNVTYYQWGRKDPLIPGQGLIINTGYVDNGNKRLYDNAYNFLYLQNSAFVNIQTTILNPYQFFLYWNNDWNDMHYYDLWNTNLTGPAAFDDTPVIKTIYDPSPAGYKMPCTNAYAGFYSTGAVAINSNPYWSYDPVFGYGVSVPTNSANIPAGNPATMFFGAYGERNISPSWGGLPGGALLWDNVTGFAWASAGAIDGAYTYAFAYGSGVFQVGYAHIRGWGWPIWSVKE